MVKTMHVEDAGISGWNILPGKYFHSICVNNNLTDFFIACLVLILSL